MNSSARPTSVEERERRVPLRLGDAVPLEHLVERRQGVVDDARDAVGVNRAHRFHCASPASYSVYWYGFSRICACGDLGVHPALPDVVAELALRELDGLLDRPAGRAEVDADEPALVLDHAPVDEHGVHVRALRLEGDVAVGVQDREHDRRVLVLDEHDVGLLALLEAADLPVLAQRLAAAAGRPVDDLLGAQVVVGDRLLLGVRLEVLARAVGAERRAHRAEEVAAPPHARVHRQRDRDVVLAQLPGRRVALAGALLALRRDRHGAAGRRDAVVGVLGQRGGVDVDVPGRHEVVLVHQPDAVVVGRAPHARVRRHRDAELARDLERLLLGERRVARDVERHLEAEHVVGGAEAAVDEGAEVLRRRPLPRALLDVPVGEHEAAGDRLQRVDGRVGVVDGLQPVRPVDGRRHAGVERLDRRQQVARVDVLRAEDLAPLEVEEDEVLRQRPVGAVAAQRGLPHVPVGVDHPRHHDAVRGVDLVRALRRLEARADPGDPVVDHEDVGVVQDVVGVVHRQHRAPAQDDRPARLDRGGVTAHASRLLLWDKSRHLSNCAPPASSGSRSSVVVAADRDLRLLEQRRPVVADLGRVRRGDARRPELAELLARQREDDAPEARARDRPPAHRTRLAARVHRRVARDLRGQLAPRPAGELELRMGGDVPVGGLRCEPDVISAPVGDHAIRRRAVSGQSGPCRHRSREEPVGRRLAASTASSIARLRLHCSPLRTNVSCTGSCSRRA